MKKYVHIAVALLVLLLCAVILSGCNISDTVYTSPSFRLESSQMSSPDKITIDTLTSYNFPGSEQGHPRLYYATQIALVLAGNEEGELLCFVYDNNYKENSVFRFKVYPALYLVTPDNNTFVDKDDNLYGIKTIEPDKGNKIINADFNQNWLVWTEANAITWQTYKLNRKTNQQELIAQGTLLGKSPEDIPAASVYEDYAVFNINDLTTKTNKVILYNLAQDTTKIIAESDTSIQYFGHPTLDNDYIVWHTVYNNPEKPAQVYLYEISSAKTEKLSVEGEYSYSPFVRDGYTVWLVNDPELPEKVFLVGYDLATANNIFKTEITPGNKYSFYEPTLAYGKVIWNSATDFQPMFYDFGTQEVDTFDLVEETTYFEYIPNELKIHSTWVTWRYPWNLVPSEDNSQYIGTYFLSLD